MIFPHIMNYLNQVLQSIGLSPVFLFSTIALLCLIFIFGLVLLYKIRRIGIDLINVNQNFDKITQILQEDRDSLKEDQFRFSMEDGNLNIELQKPEENNSKNKSPDRIIPFSEIHGQSLKQTKINSELGSQKKELLENLKKESDLKHKILKYLRKNSKPISYSEIAKYLSRGSSESDYELILKELDQLSKEGKIISQVSAGKLFFQKKIG